MERKKLTSEFIDSIEQISEYIHMSSDERRKIKRITAIHPLKVTSYYLSLIDWSNPTDPIRKMVIPSLDELNLEGSYDTSGEAKNTKLQGLQHKYSETALILATNRCATYCRYCFRKRLVGRRQTSEIISDFNDAVQYVKHHTEINNVLISGGDPLVLPTKIIEAFLSALSEVPHLDFIRFGSKAPVTFPSRFKDNELSEVMKAYSSPERRIFVVTQFNHPIEITKLSIEAVDNLIRSGVVVNNQTVLLKGVNDNPETMADLQNKLVGIGVNPYYVFQCRPVKRAKKQFQVPIFEGVNIIEKAKTRCNGLSKRFRYIMSHRTGKIEIIGIVDNYIYFKYHQAKNRGDISKIFKRKIDTKAAWLDDFKT